MRDAKVKLISHLFYCLVAQMIHFAVQRFSALKRFCRVFAIKSFHIVVFIYERIAQKWHLPNLTKNLVTNWVNDCRNLITGRRLDGRCQYALARAGGGKSELRRAVCR